MSKRRRETEIIKNYFEFRHKFFPATYCCNPIIKSGIFLTAFMKGITYVVSVKIDSYIFEKISL